MIGAPAAGVALGAPQTAAAGGDVALMPLGAADFGGLADGLAVTSDAITESAADAAGSSSVACETPAGMRRRGWREGATLAFGDVGGGALRRRSGVVGATSTVDRYRDGAAAARSIVAELAADRATLGGRSGIGGTVLSWRASPVPALGPEARLVRETIGLGRPRLWGAYLVARHGDLVTVTGIVRADAASPVAALTQAAGALQARVDGVLQGQIKAPPAGAPAPAAAHPAAPTKGPRLERMTLAPPDVAPRAYSSSGFYSLVAQGTAGYHSEVSSACQTTAIDAVQLDTLLTPNRTIANLTLGANYRGLRHRLTARAVVAAGGGLISAARVRPLTIHHPGANVKALDVRATGPLGPSEVVVGVVEVDRVVSILSIGSRTGRLLDRGEPARLVGALQRRISKELTGHRR